MLNKIIKYMLCIISCIFIAYIIASIADVNMHNLSDYEYSWWNVFTFISTKHPTAW